MPTASLSISIRPRRVLAAMLAIAGILTAITVVVHLLAPIPSRSPTSPYQALLGLPDAAVEQSIANWYTGIVMLGCASLMAWVGLGRRRSGGPYALHWLGLAALFVFFSLDEGAGVHEAVGDPLREAFGLGGILYWGWIVPWGAAVIVCAIAYGRFLIALPTGVRRVIFAAATLYISAALGLELVEGHLYTSGETGSSFEAAGIAQEFGEMTALALLAYGLLLQLAGERAVELRTQQLTPRQARPSAARR